MYDLFWVCPNKNKDHWILYLNHHETGHLSMSSADSLSRLMTNFQNIVTRYRNEYKFMSKVRSMSETPVTGEDEKNRLESLYDLYKDEYKDLLRDSYDDVRETLKVMALKDRPFNKVMARLKKDFSALGKTTPQLIGIDLAQGHDTTVMTTYNKDTKEIVSQEVIPPVNDFAPKPVNRSLVSRLKRVRT